MTRIRFGAALILGLATLGCHAQVPPTAKAVALTWTAPAVVSGYTNVFVVSRAAAVSGVCPAAAGAAYTPLDSEAPATGTSYTDASAAGLTVCYIAQTEWTSGTGCTSTAPCVSNPSNVAGPFTVPPNPDAPPSVSGTSTNARDEPPLPAPNPTMESENFQLAGTVRASR